MAPLSPVIGVILFAHFCGDFIAQSNWMAMNKSKRLVPLVVHIFVYTMVIISITMLGAWGLGLPLGWVVKWGLLNGAAHFCVDFVTSRISSRAWANKKTKLFWTVIGFDQLLHALCLLFLM